MPSLTLHWTNIFWCGPLWVYNDHCNNINRFKMAWIIPSDGWLFKSFNWFYWSKRSISSNIIYFYSKKIILEFYQLWSISLRLSQTWGAIPCRFLLQRKCDALLVVDNNNYMLYSLRNCAVPVKKCKNGAKDRF